MHGATIKITKCNSETTNMLSFSLHFSFQKLLGVLILVRIFKDSCKNIYNPPPFEENLFICSDTYVRRVKIQQTHFVGADI